MLDDSKTARGSQKESGPLWIATVGLAALVVYLGIVLLLDRTVLGVEMVDWLLFPLFVAAAAVIHVGLRALERSGRIHRSGLFAAGALGLAASTSFVVIDVAYTLYLNRRPDVAAMRNARRRRDPRTWHGEIFPRSYQPTEWNFGLHKPGVRIEADTYGDFYDTNMLASPTLRDSVLDLHRVSYYIDEHGFRETTPLSEARLFALGDSFAYGFGLEQPLVWTQQLEEISGRAVYNLGMSSTGPANEVRVLRYVLENAQEDVHVDRVLWLIYSGNDLENSYDARSHLATGPGGILRGTVLESMRAIPRALQKQSVIDRLRTGSVRAKPSLTGGRDPTLVDGVRVPYPLYFSKVLGPKMFNPDHIERGARPLSYVRNHPHFEPLRATFVDMQALARTYDFDVTVVLVPTATRVHGWQFEDFPEISKRPHFLDEVAEMARSAGFDVVDLLPELTRLGEHELLYFRDDHHWNARGNRVVAEILNERLSAPVTQPSSEPAGTAMPPP